jgi:hypothetical protein
MKSSALSFPILSVVCVGLAYGLLGWKLSAISALWLMIEALLATIVMIYIIIWRGNFLGRLVSIGPRSLVSIFISSMIITISAVYAESFAMALILLLTLFWSRLEMQIHGVKRITTLSILSLVVGCSMTGGWFLARNLLILEMLQRPAQWLQSL